MNKITIYSKKITPRLTYVLDFIFKQIYKVTYTLTDNPLEFPKNISFKINYSNVDFDSSALFIPAEGLLFQKSITDRTFDELVKQAKTTKKMDFFSIIFLFLSRYEEYRPFKEDKHGRFSSSESISHRFNLLQVPIVDICLDRLKEIIENKFPQLHLSNSSPQFQPTFDVDMVWSHLHKGALRQVGSSLKDLMRNNYSTIVERVKVLFRFKKDPFFSFDYLKNIHLKYQLNPIYFFLVANYSRFDKNISHQNKYQQKLISKIANTCLVGLHSSYYSHNRKNLIVTEKKRLENIIHQKIEHNRQHYLKLSLPKTYRWLIATGIKHDYSMGYAETIGFRAGTAHSFYWYDLIKEQTTDLRIHPFQVMDVSLKNYLKLTPEEAVSVTINIVDQIKKHGGTFHLLWHNSSFDEKEWKGWKEVYEAIIKYATHQLLPNHPLKVF